MASGPRLHGESFEDYRARLNGVQGRTDVVLKNGSPKVYRSMRARDEQLLIRKGRWAFAGFMVWVFILLACVGYVYVN